MFGKEAVLITYATTGATEEAREGRRKALCQWTREALAKREAAYFIPMRDISTEEKERILGGERFLFGLDVPEERRRGVSMRPGKQVEI